MVQGYGEANSHSKHVQRERGVVKRYCCSDGYVRLYLPEHPRSGKNGLVMEHRVVVETIIGRCLRRNETVHHKNGVKSDNNPSNLLLMSKKQHVRFHNKKGVTPRKHVEVYDEKR